MKGVIFNIVEDVVSEHLGPLAWDELLAAAELEHGHTALGTYDDAELLRIVDRAAALLDTDRRRMLTWTGRRATVYFARRYPQFFVAQRSARDFLSVLNQIIHPDVRKLDPKARPPSFDCNHLDTSRMEVIYRSHRPLCGLAEGLMYGLAEYFDERVEIEHPECELAGGACCRFELAFV